MSTQSYSTVRSTFLEFFLDRSHTRIVGSTLLPPPGDPVLFTTSGMHPLTPFLEGLPHPDGRRLVNVQRCLRTTDLDEVGDPTHLTVFQMLGSWSLGDYPGPDSLRWGLELLTDGFGIPVERLHVTVFGGDGPVPLDVSSLSTWDSLGVPVEQLGMEDNWWSNGPTGPCGPDSEIFVWTGGGDPTGSPSTDDRWVEVWNHVMMRYRRLPDGSLVPLVQQNVDTGMGFERLLMVLQQVPSVYETDVFGPWQQLSSLWGLSGTDLRLVSDHLRSSLVVLGDGVLPSNTGRGYVLRRLLRRTLTRLWSLDPSVSLSDLPQGLPGHTLDVFELPSFPSDPNLIISQEEGRFRSLLLRGRREVEKQLRRGPIGPGELHYLHDTHGLPPEVVGGILEGLRP